MSWHQCSVFGSTATAVCGIRIGRGPGQTASMWPLWLWMCWLLSGPRPVLCLGWSHLLQILPCWSLHQEVPALTHSPRQIPSFPACRCVCVISALHTFASSLLFHHSTLALNVTMLWGWFIKSVPQAQRGTAASCYVTSNSMHLITALPLFLSLSSPLLLFSIFPFALPLHFVTCSKSLSPFTSLAPVSADDSGGRMFAMATLSSCATGCKLTVSV